MTDRPTDWPASGRPDCYGDIAVVFPVGPDGLRASPPDCLACAWKTDCLRTAITTPQGAAVDRGGVIPGSPSRKAMKGLRRWSALKAQRQRDRKERP